MSLEPHLPIERAQTLAHISNKAAPTTSRMCEATLLREACISPKMEEEDSIRFVSNRTTSSAPSSRMEANLQESTLYSSNRMCSRDQAWGLVKNESRVEMLSV